MSYDLAGARPRRGESVESAFLRLEELAQDETPPTVQEWTLMERIGDALAAIDPAADRFQDRDGGVVEITTDRFQVSVFKHEAAIATPYWDEAHGVMERIAAYLAVLEQEGGFRFWDPQTEQEVTAATLGGEGYASSFETVRPVLEELRQPPAGPRWKFWKR